jgi:DNA-binding NtrC family response regulator
LLYRLNTLEVQLPPLRERSEDILPLARLFLARSAQRYGRNNLHLSASAEHALRAWHWPGNVRELQHLMERAALLAEHDAVNAATLTFGETTVQAAPTSGLDDMTLDEAEALLVKRAVGRHGGNLQRAADALGITRQSLYRRLAKHGLAEATDDAD